MAQEVRLLCLAANSLLLTCSGMAQLPQQLAIAQHHRPTFRKKNVFSRCESFSSCAQCLLSCHHTQGPWRNPEPRGSFQIRVQHPENLKLDLEESLMGGSRQGIRGGQVFLSQVLKRAHTGVDLNVSCGKCLGLL